MSDDVQEIIEQLKTKLMEGLKFERGQAFSSTGQIYWQEPEERYNARLESYGSEYTDYLKKKRESVIEEMGQEVAKLSELIDKFEEKIKEKE